MNRCCLLIIIIIFTIIYQEQRGIFKLCDLYVYTIWYLIFKNIVTFVVSFRDIIRKTIVNAMAADKLHIQHWIELPSRFNISFSMRTTSKLLILLLFYFPVSILYTILGTLQI